MGVQERKEREKQEMRQLILQTAKQVFVEEGYDKTSIRAIADRIEYSPATIYLYFKDKDELLFAVHELGFEAMLASMAEVVSIADPVERLRQMGKKYLAFAVENPEMYDLMFTSMAPMNAIDKFQNVETQEWDYGCQVFNVLCTIIQESMDKGLIRQSDLYVAALSIWSFVHGLATLHIRDRLKVFPCELDMNQLIDESIDNLITLIKI